MAVHFSTILYQTSLCLYFTLSLLYMALPNSITLHNFSTWLSYTLLWLWLYLTLLHYTKAQLASTFIYYIHNLAPLHLTIHSTMALLGSTYYSSTCLNYTLPYHYLALLHSTMPLLGSTRLYHFSTWLDYSLPWLYLPLLDSTMVLLSSTTCTKALLDSTTLYRGSTWLLHSTIALLHSTMALLCSTWLYYTAHVDDSYCVCMICSQGISGNLLTKLKIEFWKCCI